MIQLYELCKYRTMNWGHESKTKPWFIKKGFSFSSDEKKFILKEN